MTAQKHIDAIGQAQVRCEEASREVRQAARKLDKALADLHKELDAAQVAYKGSGKVVTLYSGGTNKPDRPPVDEPLDPIPGP